MPPATKGAVTGLGRIAGLVISLIACIWIFFGAIIIVGGAVTKGLFDNIGSGTDVSNAVGGAIAVFGIIILVLALIELAGGLGTLFGKDWGRVISIIYALLFGIATLLIGLSAFASSRNDAISSGATTGGLFFIAHAIAYIFVAIVLIVRWRGRATA
jgi:hypothetical protein